MRNYTNWRSGTPVYALNFSHWKKSVVRQCFPDARLVFVSDLAKVPHGAVLVVWGLAQVAEALSRELTVLRLEDGFLRSVGLGADLIRPVSWVIDSVGIYYDATRPSQLEQILSTTEFSPACLHRASILQARIVGSGITKYNVGNAVWQRPAGIKKVILVPGQVESDASLRYGAPQICTNMGLLQAVRAAHQDAYIIYKPHPDVLAGLRAKGHGEDEALNWCDEQVTGVAMAALLDSVDEVQVLTSLTGFEALLRNKAVTCYGQPFYSGWGLTTDKVANPRRQRRLSLAELVAGALIEYPVYLSRFGPALISPEQALDELVAWRNKDGGSNPWWREGFRMILRQVVGVR